MTRSDHLPIRPGSWLAARLGAVGASLRLCVATAFLAVAMAVSSTPTAAQVQGQWIVLGEQAVGFDASRGTVRVARNDVVVSRIRLEAAQNDIHMLAIRVLHANRYSERFPIDQLVQAGGAGFELDLGSERSFVREIELSYRARPGFDGRAVVRILGLAPGAAGRVPDAYSGRPAPLPPSASPLPPPIPPPLPPPLNAPPPRADADSGTGNGDGDGFEEVDSQRVDLRADQHILHASRAGLPLEAVRIRASGNPVFVRRLLLVYASGESREVRIGELIEPGTPSPDIDVGRKGDELAEVVVVTRPQTDGPRFSRLALLGLVAQGSAPSPAYPRHADRGERRAEPPGRRFPPGPWAPAYPDTGSRADWPNSLAPPPPIGPDGVPEGRWVLLGTERIGSRSDRDTVPVGLRMGRLTGLALRVLGNDVLLHEVAVTYGNGETEVFALDKEIFDGTVTPSLPLRGSRFVDRVDLVYQTTGEGRGRATVEVYGEADWPARSRRW